MDGAVLSVHCFAESVFDLVSTPVIELGVLYYPSDQTVSTKTPNVTIKNWRGPGHAVCVLVLYVGTQ